MSMFINFLFVATVMVRTMFHDNLFCMRMVVRIVRSVMKVYCVVRYKMIATNESMNMKNMNVHQATREKQDEKNEK